jgi:all-trans-retinol 13,14-reductase
METKICNDLDVFNAVKFIPIPEFYRFVNSRYDVTIPHDPKLATEILSGLFPTETEGIHAYFNHILSPRKKAAGNELPDISLGIFLDSIIHNDDLKLILLGNLGYYHDDPYSLSLAYYASAQGSYYSGGASFIKGGSQQLSDHLANFIRSHRGEVLLKHEVTAIKTDSHQVTGVLYKKKERQSAGIFEVDADEIIANSAMPNVANLLPEGYGDKLKKELQHHELGASLLTVYFGFKKPLKEMGWRHYSTFIYDNTVPSQQQIRTNNRDDFSRRNFTFVDYSQIDSGLAKNGKATGVVCCIDYLEDWENLDRKSYNAKKRQVASIFIERLEKMIPGIRDVIEYHEVATPLTLKRYTLNPGGAVYGFAQTPSRKAIDTSTLPENLHFASAWGMTGGGFSGVIYGGYLCAIRILRKNRNVSP